MEKFSSRHGFSSVATEILYVNDVPYELREALIIIANEAGLTFKMLQKVVCNLLRKPTEEDDISFDSSIKLQLREHLKTCEWFKIYDIIEACHEALIKEVDMLHQTRRPQCYLDESGEMQEVDPVCAADENLTFKPDYFANEINKYFVENGIGWKLDNARLEFRGDENFQEALLAANKGLNEAQLTTSASRFQEALLNLSRRPVPEIHGAIYHAMAGLECAMREVTDDHKLQLSDPIARQKGFIPAPLDAGIKKIYEFASDRSRHINEGRLPDLDEAVLVVHVAAALAAYLSNHPNLNKKN